MYKKYSSFQRQLHIYGFRRITKGIDKNCYYHEYFLRGHYHLIQKITRCPVKNGADPPTLATKTPEPDFYSMAPQSTVVPASATGSQRVGRDSYRNEPPTACVTARNDRPKPQLVSQFIRNHFTNARKTARMNSDTKSKQESEAFPTFPPPRQVDSSIFALLERLQEVSTTPDVTVTVSTHNNNHELSITSHENLQLGTDHSSQQLSQSEGNILSKLLFQAEQNRIQFQSLMNPTRSSQLLSTSQHQQQQQNSLSAPALLHYAQQGAANFTDDLQQNQARLATTVSNEEIVRNTLALLASSS